MTHPKTATSPMVESWDRQKSKHLRSIGASDISEQHRFPKTMFEVEVLWEQPVNLCWLLLMQIHVTTKTKGVREI